MKYSQLYRLLSEIATGIEILDEQPTELSKSLDNLHDKLFDAHDTILKHLSKNNVGEVTGDKSKSSKPDHGLDSGLQDAYDVLKHQSKPGPTLLVKKLGIEQDEAKQLFKELIEMGKIVKGQRAEELPEQVEDEPKKTTEKKTTKKKTTEKKTTKKSESSKEPDLMELIGDLPEGTDLLLPKHLHSLIALPEANRDEYLSGLNLKDLIDADDVARASANGVNTILVDQVNALSDVKVKPNKDVIEIAKDGDKQAQKYFKLRAKFIKSIPMGKELYKFMSRHGVTRRVLGDLKKIAEASANGEL